MGNFFRTLAEEIPLKKPWRETAGVFSRNEKTQLLSSIRSLMPPDPCKAINLIVIGYAGSGKSSFVNTLNTVFRDSDQISTISASYGICQDSVTKKLLEIRLTNFSEDDNKKIRIYDCRGIARDNEQNIQRNTAFEDDLMKAIDGHIMKDYEFQTTTIQEDCDFYRDTPTISDRMHCVLLVINEEHLTEEEEMNGFFAALLRIQNRIAGKNIPLRLILTKMDELNLRGSKLNGIFHSRKAQSKLEKAKEIFGVQDCQILPIANYVNEFKQNDTQDVLALLAMNNIIQEALTYIKNEI